MRGKFGGTAVACIVTLSMAALSGCSVSFVDALSDSSKAIEGPRTAEVEGSEGRSHEAEGDSGHSDDTDRGATEDTGESSGNNPREATAGDSGESSDRASSGRGTGNEGAPAGEESRPEGHEGLWFDSEPKDPWDKYVWKSQKFIGKGGDIPKLGPGTADKTFWGLPDLCSKQMQKKMKVVGFDFSDRGANDSGLRDCYWVESSSTKLLFSLRSIIIMYSNSPHGYSRISKSNISWPRSKFQAVENVNHLPDFQCAAQRRIDGNKYLTILLADMESGVNLQQACDRSIALAQVIENLT